MNVRTDATVLHVDLDAFFAAVEVLEQPALRGQAVVVGGLGPRGVVSTASYEARRFGVQSAIPMAIARRRCPHAVFLAPRHDLYREYSEKVMRVMRDITPLVEPISLDEAFLEVGGVRRLHGEPVEIATRLRAEITEVTGGLTASVGIATTKMLAKIASDAAKPDGILAFGPEEELPFLHALPVERMWGVGRATLERLHHIGVRTVGDLAAVDVDRLVALLGDATGRHLADLARNHDPRAVEPERAAKSIGNEETFATDVTDRAELERELVRLVDRVARRMRQADVRARTITLKVRYADFRTITRSRTVDVPVDLARDVLTVARTLLDDVSIGGGVRLLGVHAHQLVRSGETIALQPDLFGEAPDEQPGRASALERISDQVRDRFGDGAVRPASLIRTERRSPRGGP